MPERCSDLDSIVNPQEKCNFARANCDLGSLVHYASLTYCTLQSAFAQIALLSTLVLFYFAAMGIAAFDYLSPNLTHLAEVSGLSQSLMGVTVLAFGNGSVDVFGAVAALHAGEGGMAFGEIMGGALFVCTFVIGSMAVIQPFTIEPQYTLRDSAVLAVCVIYTMIIVLDGVITLLEALVGLCLYIGYAVFVVRQQLNLQHHKSHTRHEEQSAQGAIPQIEEPISPISQGSLHSVDTPYTPLRPSLFSAVHMNFKVKQSLAEIEETLQPMSSSHPSNSVDMSRRGSASDAVTASSNTQLNSISPVLSSRSAVSSPELLPAMIPHPHIGTNRFLSPPNLPKLSTSLHVPGPSFAPQSSSAHRQLSLSPDHNAHAGCHHPHSTHANHRHKDFSMKHLVDRLLESRLESSGLTPVASPAPEYMESTTTDEGECPISTLDVLSGESSLCEAENIVNASWIQLIFPSLLFWERETLAYKLHLIATFPITSVLSWTIPSSSKSCSRRQICIYSLCVPLSIPIVIPKVPWTPQLACAQVICIALALLWWGKMQKPLPSSLVLASLGFFMGLMWVLLLAVELVAILTVLGEVCHVSNTVMGLTVFALGGSLGDFVSNVTVAKIGFPTMAISACLGGPIFTLLIGVSGASLFTMLRERKTQLEVPVSSSLLVSGCGLLATLALFAFSAHINHGLVTKRAGAQLIGLYFVILTGSLLSSKYI
nr:ST.18 [Starmerella bombicola]